MRSDAAANALLLTVPAALLGGALAFQYLGGLAPCEMCHWQRWALVATLGLGLAAAGLHQARALLWLTILALLADAGIAAFHAGVEQHWWQGITRCAATPVAGDLGAMMADILSQPLVRCDAIAWSMLGISMAGWNAIIASATGGLATWLMTRRP
ncbi:disulfide bond formation protein B [Sandarakinorhabdus sp.]|uniref:disulfide bond formation protein B n=1 Tax=Sandarakinorhabdus sp. TaxID=1916663 RepID=UPI00286E2AD2|nr:disulfide bond formation protein B [Sandarakinorhabdus sp.]